MYKQSNSSREWSSLLASLQGSFGKHQLPASQQDVTEVVLLVVRVMITFAGIPSIGTLVSMGDFAHTALNQFEAILKAVWWALLTPLLLQKQSSYPSRPQE